MHRSPVLSRAIAALTLAAAVAVPGLAASTSAGAATAPPPGPTTDTAYQISISHDGFSGDTTIVPPLASRWTHSFTGLVSYPLIADGMVFVTVADVSGGGYGTDLYALRRSDGSVVWSQFISGTYYWSNAAYDNGQIFVVNYDGLLQAFAATTGTLNWSVQLPGQYSFSSPPTAHGGVVYVGGAGSGGTLYAVNETNGSVLWTQAVENGDNSSPALSSTSVFVSYACGVTYSFARPTGTLQWVTSPSCEGGGGRTPVYHNGLLYMRDPILGNLILNASTGKETGTFSAAGAGVRWKDRAVPERWHFVGSQRQSHGMDVHRGRRSGHGSHRRRLYGIRRVVERDDLRAKPHQGPRRLEREHRIIHRRSR